MKLRQEKTESLSRFKVKAVVLAIYEVLTIIVIYPIAFFANSVLDFGRDSICSMDFANIVI